MPRAPPGAMPAHLLPPHRDHPNCTLLTLPATRHWLAGTPWTLRSEWRRRWRPTRLLGSQPRSSSFWTAWGSLRVSSQGRQAAPQAQPLPPLPPAAAAHRRLPRTAGALSARAAAVHAAPPRIQPARRLPSVVTASTALAMLHPAPPQMRTSTRTQVRCAAPPSNITPAPCTSLPRAGSSWQSGLAVCPTLLLLADALKKLLADDVVQHAGGWALGFSTQRPLGSAACRTSSPACLARSGCTAAGCTVAPRCS